MRQSKAPRVLIAGGSKIYYHMAYKVLIRAQADRLRRSALRPVSHLASCFNVALHRFSSRRQSARHSYYSPANSAVFPAVTVPGGTVVLHAGFTNSSSSLSPVTATVTVNNPGECVSDKVNGGALALQLGPHQTRLATLTTTVPSSACAGTYTVIVTVKNSSGTVIASHKTTFTVDPAR